MEKHTEGEEQKLEISRRIQEEADYQAADIVRRAKKEAEKILEAARQRAASEKSEKMVALEAELQKMKEHIFSSLNLEKRRIVLEERDRFIKEILEETRRQAELFRSSAEYPAFLGKAVLEGIPVLDQNQVRVVYSSLDQAVFTEGFLADLKKACQRQQKREVTFFPEKGDFADIGVQLRSMDGRVVFDNTFSSRLERMLDEIYVRLLKESF